MNPTNACPIIFDAIAGLICLAALVRIWSTPSWMWPHGVGSKLGWTATTFWLIIITGHFTWPLGAVLAIRKVHQHRRLAKAMASGPTIPMATSAYVPEVDWWNIDRDSPTTPVDNRDHFATDPEGNRVYVIRNWDDREPEPEDDDYDREAGHRRTLERIVAGEAQCSWISLEDARRELAAIEAAEPVDPSGTEGR